MKTTILTFILSLTAGFFANAEVTIKELEESIRVEVDGKLFTEWQHKAWFAPYLYPVIGPDGENITRNFPMKEDVEGEQQDHPHHRSIKFSHRNVNGYSFWAPNGEPGPRDCEIKLIKIEKMEGGDKGELIIHNDWIGEGKLVLKERLRLAFMPLEEGQMLMDYDTELTAAEGDVKFGDNKDGGMGIRVAATMVVENRHTKTGNGTIVNSNGETNAASWGKRAKWSDYYGPSPGGTVVGIAIFDHPSNLRYPTHWHARTYGLSTANRFGTGSFERSSGAKEGDGDYTIKKGDTLKLRHRLYFHLGDAKTANVDKHYANYEKEK
ncbi:MAG: PmoA family protein [Verrucomicrobiota bacterium]